MADNSWSLQNCGNGGTPIINAGKVDIEIKKSRLLACGTAPDVMRTCSMCNVICNSEEAFSKHLSGRKHISQERLMAGINPDRLAGAGAAKESQVVKVKEDVKTGDECLRCDACGVRCNSSVVFHMHISGKKHKKNIEKPSSMGELGADCEKKGEDGGKNIQMKMQRLVQSGVDVGLVHVCTICSVVCNSVYTFSHHLKGRKHEIMAGKMNVEGSAPTAGFTQI